MTLPVKKKSGLEMIVEAATSDSMPPMLKFKKDGFFIRDTAVPLGTRFVAYCGDWRRGWAEFVGGEKVAEKIGRVVDGFVVPDRSELGDDDASQWETGIDGKPSDPWSRQDYLPIENVESGERLLFVTSSFGGRIGIESLMTRFARNADRGLPVIELRTAKFSTKKFGAVNRPDFPIVDWEGPQQIDNTSWFEGEKQLPDRARASLGVAAGPPESDPEDPGFDATRLSRDDDDEVPF
jgi:hypothetical protein